MSRWLIAGALGLLGLLVGLLFLMRDSKPISARHAIAKVDAGATSVDVAARAVAARAPDAGVSVATFDPGPSLPIVTRELRDGGTYERRDHRGLPNTARKSPIMTSTVVAVRSDVTGKVKACAAPLAKKSPPQKGRIMVTFRAVARAGRVLASEVKVKQADIEDAELVACVTQAFESTSIAQPADQPDADYRVALPFNVP